MVEDENLEEASGYTEREKESQRDFCGCFCIPIRWFKMLASEMHWSFVFGVVVVYGISQGLGGALNRVGMEYYMKDVQKVQPSEAQIYTAITSIPWIVKPLWGLLTDVLPILGYHRRPYFILAADMQSLCALSSSIGALVGFFISGIFVHLIGPKGVFGLLTIPAGLVFLVGSLLDEPYMPNFAYRQVNQKFLDAVKAMWTTLKCPDVWKPCLYMYLSIALSLDIHEGMFYWYTDSKGGPSLSQESVGYIFSIGSVGSLLGAILYQNVLKDYPFRDLLFWTQLLFGLSGMLDLILVLRLNLKFGLSDYFFIVIDESVYQMIARLKWMPLLVLSSKLCPSGIAGTFFALLMSIDNVGILSASWGGGFLLHILEVTRTKFDGLWLAILIRNLLRISPLCLLYLIPRGDPNSSILPSEVLGTKEGIERQETENIELVSLINDVDVK
ncbi:hypothetical protein I3760_07G227200 [Carya illinoinensis]|nr:hypothetical protein I3760_07G227200 [Carya illinoinensis]